MAGWGKGSQLVYSEPSKIFFFHFLRGLTDLTQKLTGRKQGEDLRDPTASLKEPKLSDAIPSVTLVFPKAAESVDSLLSEQLSDPRLSM